MPWGSIGCVSGNAPILPKRSGSDELSGFQGGRSGERDRLPRQPHDIKRQTNQELRPRLRRNGWDRVSGSGGSPSRAGCAGSANPGGRGGGMATGAAGAALSHLPGTACRRAGAGDPGRGGVASAAWVQRRAPWGPYGNRASGRSHRIRSRSGPCRGGSLMDA